MTLSALPVVPDTHAHAAVLLGCRGSLLLVWTVCLVYDSWWWIWMAYVLHGLTSPLMSGKRTNCGWYSPQPETQQRLLQNTLRRSALFDNSVVEMPYLPKCFLETYYWAIENESRRWTSKLWLALSLDFTTCLCLVFIKSALCRTLGVCWFHW